MCDKQWRRDQFILFEFELETTAEMHKSKINSGKLKIDPTENNQIN